jgi:hypothetical protein
LEIEKREIFLDKLLTLFLIYNFTLLSFQEPIYKKIVSPFGDTIYHHLELSLSDFYPKIMNGGNACVGLETTRSMAERVVATAAINGGFYRAGICLGASIGLSKIDGELSSMAVGQRGAIGWSKANSKSLIDRIEANISFSINNQPFKIHGINQELCVDGLTLYTSSYSRTTLTPNGTPEYLLWPNGFISYLGNQGSCEIPKGCSILSLGKKVSPFRLNPMNSFYKLEYQVIPLLSKGTKINWKDFDQILQAGPILVYQNELVIDQFKEPFPQEIRKDQKYARTAIGLRPNGNWLIVAAEASKATKTIGVTLYELAEHMKKSGCTYALNLDGGGSSTFYYNGKIRSKPSSSTQTPVGHPNIFYTSSDGERPVGNCIVFLPKNRN